MTFVVTVRRVSPSLEKMINFCYLHYCPEGSSIGLTHLSFPLHCFSNGNGIEGTASWVCLAETLLSRGGAGEKKKKLYLLIIKQPYQHGTAAATRCKVFLALVNSKIILRAMRCYARSIPTALA